MRYLKEYELFEQSVKRKFIFPESNSERDDKIRFLGGVLDYLKSFISRSDLFDEYPDIWFYLTFCDKTYVKMKPENINHMIAYCDTFTDDENGAIDDIDYIIKSGLTFRPKKGIPWEMDTQKAYDRLFGRWWAELIDVDGDVSTSAPRKSDKKHEEYDDTEPLGYGGMMELANFPIYYIRQKYGEKLGKFMILCLEVMSDTVSLTRAVLQGNDSFDPEWITIF